MKSRMTRIGMVALLVLSGFAVGCDDAEDATDVSAVEEGGDEMAMEEGGDEMAMEEGGDEMATEEGGDEASGEEGGEELLSIAATATAAGTFNTLLAAVEAGGLTETLSGEGTFTVFAPTDDAFAALPDGTVDAVLGNPDLLSLILTYHVLDSVVLAETVVTLTSATTLSGLDITIEVVDGGVVLNGTVNVTATDILCTNGVIHVIDGVLMPPEEGGEEATEGGEEATEGGEEATEGGEEATEGGEEATEGGEEATEGGEEATADCPADSIAGIASVTDDLSTLVAALDAADLVTTFCGEGEFTVFAPTNDAFAALPEGTVEALLEDIPALTAILTYHVLAGVVPSSVITGSADAIVAETLNGADITASVVDGNVMINDAMVIIADIEASNGVVHVIDAVLLPPEGDE